MKEPIMNEHIDGYHDCPVLGKQVYLTGNWYIHETSTGPTPKADFGNIKDFRCDPMSKCGYNISNCPVKKAMEAELNKQFRIRQQ